MQLRSKVRQRSSTLAAAVVGVLCAAPALGADLYWDANGGTAGTGGNGNWTTPSNVNNWRSGGTGGGLVNWTDGNNAFFPSSAGSVTLDSAVSATGLVFQVNNYTLTGTNTLTLTGTPIIKLDSTGSSAFSATINNPLASAVAVSLQRGAGTGNQILNLGGTNNLTGGISLDHDGIRLNLNSTGALNGGSTVTLVGNQNTITTLQGGAGPTGTFSFANAFSLNPLNTANFLASFASTKKDLLVNFTGQFSGNADVVISSNGTANNSNGGGITVFSNTANNYTGATIINIAANTGVANDHGVFRIGAAGALPTGTAVIFGRGASGTANNVGAMDVFGNSISISSLATNLGAGQLAGGITNSQGSVSTITITGSSTTSFAGAIGAGAATGNLNVTGGDALAVHLASGHTGSLTLTGLNTYANGTTINGGTLVLGHTATTGNTITSDSTVNSGGTLASIAGTQATTGRSGGAVTVNSGGTISPGTNGGIGTLVAASLTANSGSVYRFDLASTSNYDVMSLGAGALTLDSGTHTLDVYGTANVGSYTLMSYGSRIWDSTNAFTLGATPGGAFSYSLAQSDSSVILNIAALTPILAWDIGGGGSPIVEGAGTWQHGSTDFTDIASNTGATFSNAASFDVTFGNDIAGSGGVVTLGSNVRTGGKLIFGPISSAAPYQIGTLGSTNTLTTSSNGILANSSGSIEAPVVMEASQTWTANSGNTLTVNGSVSETGGAATLTKAGSGTVILNGSNSFAGGVNITAGTLAAGNGGALGSGLTTISNGAVLRTSASISLPNAISIDSTGGSISVDGLLASTISGNITGSGALTKVGAGTLELTGTNTFSSLNISGGILAAGAESALGAGSISLSNSGVLKATAGFSTTKTVNMSVNNTNGQVDTNGFDVTFAGTLTGPGNLFKSGAGTLLITGSNSAYAGQTEFPVTTGGGVIETTTINALGSGNFRVQANGTLRTTNDLTIGAIRGTSVLTKTGAGKLTVTGSTGGNLNAGASIVVNQGSVQMDSLTGLGGNNSATAIQMPITLNSGTELLLNWSSSSESRFSKNINLNDATITRMNNAAGNDVTEFTAYSGTLDLGGALTVTGNSTIRNQQIATATDNKQLQVHMPVVVSSGGTLTLSAANNAGDYHSHRTVLRGVSNATSFPNDAVTMQAGSTMVMSGPGEKAIGNTNTHGKPIIGQGSTGNEATLKLDTHTYLTDIANAAANITKLVVSGSGDGGLRIEAAMNATYTTPNGGGAPALRTYDGTTGLFGLNTTSTQEGGTPPSGYSVIGNAYTMMSPKRFNQLSNSFGSPAVTLGGTLTLAANDAPGATGTIDNGPSAPTPIKLALDNASTSANANLVYKILPSANGGAFANFGGLIVKRSNAGTGTVSARVDPDGTTTGVLRVQSLQITDAALDLSDNDLVAQAGVFTDILGHVLTGFGTTGPGIVSSTSDGSQILALFDNSLVGASDWLGHTLNPNAIVGKYTYFGDVNIDGQVTGDDYTVIDANLNTTPPVGLGWLSGDANLDGIVTGDDYTVIDANLGLGNGNPLTPNQLTNPVPEPTALALIAAGLLSARRRRSD